MSFTDFWENELLDHILDDGAYTAPSPGYLGLSTTTPTDAGTNFTEPGGGAYARVAAAGTVWDAASGGSKDNGSIIDMGTASGASWGTVTHVGYFDASTSGNLCATAALSASKAIGDGDSAEFAAGAIAFTLD